MGERWTRPADGMVMVCAPPGEFQMGSSDGDPDEYPPHTVALDGFWIDQTEVSNAQFAAFLNARGSQREGGAAWLDLPDDDCLIERVDGEFRPRTGYANHPAVEVSWVGAAAYCEWVGSHLPTEAQWEYAARGTDGRAYPWGNIFECARANVRDGRSCSDGFERTSPVGSFAGGVSWCGALDMAGNVWEWATDWYGGYPSERQLNPTGPASGRYRVQRGGSFHFTPFSARSSNRNSHRPDFTDYNGGFRCVR